MTSSHDHGGESENRNLPTEAFVTDAAASPRIPSYPDTRR